jgi:hypothetical protein
MPLTFSRSLLSFSTRTFPPEISLLSSETVEEDILEEEQSTETLSMGLWTRAKMTRCFFPPVESMLEAEKMKKENIRRKKKEISFLFIFLTLSQSALLLFCARASNRARDSSVAMTS